MSDIARHVVFRDNEWGFGMFEDGPRTEVADGQVWLMVGNETMMLKPDGGMSADEARSVAGILLAAADEADLDAQSCVSFVVPERRCACA